MHRSIWIASIFSIALAAALVHCTADLGEGNPCRAIANAYCNTPCGTNASQSQCMGNLADAGYIDNCNVSSDNARSCASDISGQSCSTMTPPASCQNIGFANWTKITR